MVEEREWSVLGEGDEPERELGQFLDSELHYTLPIVVNAAVGSKTVRWGDFAAGAVVVSTPVMVLFYALQRYLVGGLTAGGVKG